MDYEEKQPTLAPRPHAAAPWPLAASSACCHSKPYPYLDVSKLAPVKGLKHDGGKDDEDGQLFSNDTPALPPKPKHRELPSATDDEMVAARR
ncbi:hypothetical protein OsJ_14547 [Oryza sativa Japonica Group]|uniref:Uncharacterized protein n=2 Tax=Oryza TaxID=4527 RepID=A3AT62_ORYSJ|nr:hypothetical protein OsJ_14547 [Oryza sativa Japonica Group]